MMKNITQLIVALALGIASQFAVAQPATFENGVFNIPQGAALVNGEANYYNDIQLISDVEGNFTLLAAQQANLVSIDSIAVNIAESLPVQVSVAVLGNKSVPCVELQAPAVFFADSTFTIVLAETTLGIAETCIAVLEPFETNIPLETTGLNSGTYSVVVNGIETEFDL